MKAKGVCFPHKVGVKQPGIESLFLFLRFKFFYAALLHLKLTKFNTKFSTEVCNPGQK